MASGSRYRFVSSPAPAGGGSHQSFAGVVVAYPMIAPSRTATHGRHGLSGSRSSNAFRHGSAALSIHSRSTSGGTMPGYVAPKARALTLAIPSTSPGVASRIVTPWPGSAAAIGQLEPEEVVWTERQEVGQLADAREVDPPDELDRDPPFVSREIELDVLGEARQVRDAEDRDALVLAHVGQDAPVLGMAERQGAPSEHRVPAPDAEHPLRPVQEGPGDPLLGF